VSSRLTPKRVHPIKGSFVLIEYLIPPKNTATAQGEHVFFDIDVKGGEKEWSRPDAIVGGPNRLARRDSAEVHEECKSVLVYLKGKQIDKEDQQCMDNFMERSET
jgi:hypothetical protein